MFSWRKRRKNPQPAEEMAPAASSHQGSNLWLGAPRQHFGNPTLDLIRKIRHAPDSGTWQEDAANRTKRRSRFTTAVLSSIKNRPEKPGKNVVKSSDGGGMETLWRKRTKISNEGESRCELTQRLAVGKEESMKTTEEKTSKVSTEYSMGENCRENPYPSVQSYGLRNVDWRVIRKKILALPRSSWKYTINPTWRKVKAAGRHLGTNGSTETLTEDNTRVTIPMLFEEIGSKDSQTCDDIELMLSNKSGQTTILAVGVRKISRNGADVTVQAEGREALVALVPKKSNLLLSSDTSQESSGVKCADRQKVAIQQTTSSSRNSVLLSSRDTRKATPRIKSRKRLSNNISAKHSSVNDHRRRGRTTESIKPAVPVRVTSEKSTEPDAGLPPRPTTYYLPNVQSDNFANQENHYTQSISCPQMSSKYIASPVNSVVTPTPIARAKNTTINSTVITPNTTFPATTSKNPTIMTNTNQAHMEVPQGKGSKEDAERMFFVSIKDHSGDSKEYIHNINQNMAEGSQMSIKLGQKKDVSTTSIPETISDSIVNSTKHSKKSDNGLNIQEKIQQNDVPETEITNDIADMRVTLPVLQSKPQQRPSSFVIYPNVGLYSQHKELHTTETSSNTACGRKTSSRSCTKVKIHESENSAVISVCDGSRTEETQPNTHGENYTTAETPILNELEISHNTAACGFVYTKFRDTCGSNYLSQTESSPTNVAADATIRAQPEYEEFDGYRGQVAISEWECHSETSQTDNTLWTPQHSHQSVTLRPTQTSAESPKGVLSGSGTRTFSSHHHEQATPSINNQIQGTSSTISEYGLHTRTPLIIHSTLGTRVSGPQFRTRVDQNPCNHTDRFKVGRLILFPPNMHRTYPSKCTENGSQDFHGGSSPSLHSLICAISPSLNSADSTQNTTLPLEDSVHVSNLTAYFQDISSAPPDRILSQNLVHDLALSQNDNSSIKTIDQSNQDMQPTCVHSPDTSFSAGSEATNHISEGRSPPQVIKQRVSAYSTNRNKTKTPCHIVRLPPKVPVRGSTLPSIIRNKTTTKNAVASPLPRIVSHHIARSNSAPMTKNRSPPPLRTLPRTQLRDTRPTSITVIKTKNKYTPSRSSPLSLEGSTPPPHSVKTEKYSAPVRSPILSRQRTTLPSKSLQNNMKDRNPSASPKLTPQTLALSAHPPASTSSTLSMNSTTAATLPLKSEKLDTPPSSFMNNIKHVRPPSRGTAPLTSPSQRIDAYKKVNPQTATTVTARHDSASDATGAPKQSNPHYQIRVSSTHQRQQQHATAPATGHHYIRIWPRKPCHQPCPTNSLPSETRTTQTMLIGTHPQKPTASNKVLRPVSQYKDRRSLKARTNTRLSPKSTSRPRVQGRSEVSANSRESPHRVPSESSKDLSPPVGGRTLPKTLSQSASASASRKNGPGYPYQNIPSSARIPTTASHTLSTFPQLPNTISSTRGSDVTNIGTETSVSVPAKKDIDRRGQIESCTNDPPLQCGADVDHIYQSSGFSSNTGGYLDPVGMSQIGHFDGSAQNHGHPTEWIQPGILTRVSPTAIPATQALLGYDSISGHPRQILASSLLGQSTDINYQKAPEENVFSVQEACSKLAPTSKTENGMNSWLPKQNRLTNRSISSNLTQDSEQCTKYSIQPYQMNADIAANYATTWTVMHSCVQCDFPSSTAFKKQYPLMKSEVRNLTEKQSFLNESRHTCAAKSHLLGSSNKKMVHLADKVAAEDDVLASVQRGSCRAIPDVENSKTKCPEQNTAECDFGDSCQANSNNAGGQQTGHDFHDISQLESHYGHAYAPGTDAKHNHSAYTNDQEAALKPRNADTISTEASTCDEPIKTDVIPIDDLIAMSQRQHLPTENCPQTYIERSASFLGAEYKVLSAKPPKGSNKTFKRTNVTYVKTTSTSRLACTSAKNANSEGGRKIPVVKFSALPGTPNNNASNVPKKLQNHSRTVRSKLVRVQVKTCDPSKTSINTKINAAELTPGPENIITQVANPQENMSVVDICCTEHGNEPIEISVITSRSVITPNSAVDGNSEEKNGLSHVSSSVCDKGVTAFTLRSSNVNGQLEGSNQEFSQKVCHTTTPSSYVKNHETFSNDTMACHLTGTNVCSTCSTLFLETRGSPGTSNSRILAHNSPSDSYLSNKDGDDGCHCSMRNNNIYRQPEQTSALPLWQPQSEIPKKDSPCAKCSGKDLSVFREYNCIISCREKQCVFHRKEGKCYNGTNYEKVKMEISWTSLYKRTRHGKKIQRRRWRVWRVHNTTVSDGTQYNVANFRKNTSSSRNRSSSHVKVKIKGREI